MKLSRLMLCACTVILFACNADKKAGSILNADALAVQTFGININRDTTLLTKSGCVIKIPKGSLESETGDVKLDIKEAISNTDIVLGGLTTMSGNKALSSGGMISIEPSAGYKISIKKALAVLIPTKDYNPNMNVYSGEDSAGKINWTDPEPLPKDSLQKNIGYGEALFKANCASCHKVNIDFTGPAMRGVEKRNTFDWICRFINGPAKMIGYDVKARRVADQWKPTVMTAFPDLTREDISNILAYTSTFPKDAIESYYWNGSKARKFDKADPCFDSCNRYLRALQGIATEEDEINRNAENFFTLDRTIPIPPQPQINEIIPEQEIDTTPATAWVSPVNVTATYYTINIATFGWYNVDVLCDERSAEPSELFVNIRGSYEKDVQVNLIIPSIKAFIEGGKLADGKQYGFREVDGKIPLPQDAQCYIIAFTESKGKLFFGKADFFSARSQTISIDLTETTKKGLADAIAALKLDGVTAAVKDAKNAGKNKILDRNKAAAEKIKPKNCDCFYPDPPMAADTMFP